ncbi:MAG: cytidine deaminase [Oscillospiraceae bacterium]|nr:cytidine deaminase [Oscillospiraceae bacterium]
MDEKVLMLAAMAAREHAHCKYSGFAVGAALLTDDGQIYTGCNVENASYSLGCCAERTAIFKAVSDGKREFSAIAICGAPKGDEPDAPCIPCGACLQVMAEFCGDDFPIVLSDGVHVLKEFLPVRFTL